jgi:hypothetical protein
MTSSFHLECLLMKSRLLLLAALAATSTGCKKEQSPASADAPTPAAAPAKKDPLAEVPQTDSTLSLLEPQDGKCQWLRADPATQKRATLASFEGDCKGGRIAWSTDQRKALVWFDPQFVQTVGYSSENASPPAYPEEKPTEGATPRLYEVTVASGEVRPLTFPKVEGELKSIAYKGADIVAISLKSLPDQTEKTLTVDGQSVTFPPDPEGLPALAYAWRLDKDGQFKRSELKGTTEGSGMAQGVGVLDAASNQGPNSTDMLASHLAKEGPEPTDEQLANLLSRVPADLVQAVQAEGLPSEASWGHGVTPAGSFFVWQVTGDTAHTTGHIVFQKGEEFELAKDLGFTDGDVVAVNSKGPFVLVSSERVGTHPRLYDLRTHKLVFRSDTARAATFWPAR